jgi:hypothetical protein
MTQSVYGLTSLADQRYYHFVVIEEQKGLSLGAYWRKVGDLREPARSLSFTDGDFVVQHRKLRSRRGYARGAVGEKLSEKGDGKPPFLYDVVAMKASLSAASFLIIGFPFAGLALDTVRELIDDHGLLRLGHFVAVDVPGLVGVMEKGFPVPYRDLASRAVGVQFVVKHDKNLTAIRMGGDDPLSAEIYVRYLRQKMHSKRMSPDQCVLACEREWPPGPAWNGSRSFRSRIHFDTNGNFKFYVHQHCENIRLLPYALGQLREADLLRRVAHNPLLKLESVDEGI